MRYMFVVAHPDDEVLGAGAFLYSISQSDGEDTACIVMYSVVTFRRKQDLLKARMTRKTHRTDLVFSFRATRRRRQMLLLPVLQMRSSASGERMIDD